MNVVFSLQANSDRSRLVTNAVCGNRWMLQQIKKGYPDKRVSLEHALGYLQTIREASRNIEPMYLTCHYYGYRFYKTLNATLAFYIVPIDKTPYAFMVAVNPKTNIATVMRILVSSVENAKRLLKGKGVIIDRHNSAKYKVCARKHKRLEVYSENTNSLRLTRRINYARFCIETGKPLSIGQKKLLAKYGTRKFNDYHPNQ